MINNLLAFSMNTAQRVTQQANFAWTGAFSQPRFGSRYDRYDRQVEAASSLPERLKTRAERFIATTVPDLVLTQVEDLTPKNLKRLGHIQGLIFDLDDTLMPILSGKFPETVIKTLKQLQRASIKMGVVTNNMQPGYCRNARELLRQEGLDLPFVEDAQKPNPIGFTIMQEHLGIPASQVAVVGDGYICDVRCANLLGMKTIQAGWFTSGRISTPACYTVDTVAAMAQTIRSYLQPGFKPTIIDAAFDRKTHSPTADQGKPA